MAAGDRDQLFRMPIGGAPVQVSDFGADISGFKLSPGGDRVVVWADRPDCPDLACAAATLPAKPGGSGRTYDKLFVRHWDTWAEQGTKSRLYQLPDCRRKTVGRWRPADRQSRRATRRPSPSAAARRSLSRPTAAPSISRCAKRAASNRRRPTSTSSQHPATALAAPVNLTDANDGMDNLPAVSPDGRTLAYFAMARPTYEADRQVLMLRDLASGKVSGADAGVGSLGGLDRMVARWPQHVGHRNGHSRRAGFPRGRSFGQGHAPDPRGTFRQRPRFAQGRGDRDDEQRHGAG